MKYNNITNILLQWPQNYGIWNDWYQKFFYCLCADILIDYIMIFSDYNRRIGVSITPMALAHPLHPIKIMPRNKRRYMWVGRFVSSGRPWFRPVYSGFCIHTIHYSCKLSNWNKLFLIDIHTKSWCGHSGVLDDLIRLLFPVWFQVWISVL